MVFRWLADAVMLIHGVFILFVLFGGLLLLRRPRWAWLHLPAVLWGAFIELSGGLCPLTPLEVRLRRLGGEGGYAGGFIDRYLTPLIYPEGLTREVQIVLGLGVLLLNGAIYLRLWRRRNRGTPADAAQGRQRRFDISRRLR